MLPLSTHLMQLNFHILTDTVMGAVVGPCNWVFNTELRAFDDTGPLKVSTVTYVKQRKSKFLSRNIVFFRTVLLL